MIDTRQLSCDRALAPLKGGKALYLMYAGYMAAFYIGLTIYACWSLPTHPHQWSGTLALFVLIPVLILCFSLEVVLAIPKEWHKDVRQRIANGQLTKRYTFGVGMLMRALTMLAVLAIGYVLLLLEKAKVFALGPFDSLASKIFYLSGILAILFVIAFGPSGGIWWLRRRSS